MHMLSPVSRKQLYLWCDLAQCRCRWHCFCSECFFSFSWTSVEKKKLFFWYWILWHFYSKSCGWSSPPWWPSWPWAQSSPASKPLKTFNSLRGQEGSQFLCNFPPSPYDHSTLCCSTSSIIENHITPQTKLLEMHNDSLSLLMHLWPFQHHSPDEIINHPLKTRSNHLKSPMATTISDLSAHELASSGIVAMEYSSNNANWQPLEPSLAPFSKHILPFWPALPPSVGGITSITRADWHPFGWLQLWCQYPSVQFLNTWPLYRKMAGQSFDNPTLHFTNDNLNLTICSNNGQYPVQMVTKLAHLPLQPQCHWCPMTSCLSLSPMQQVIDLLHSAQHAANQHNQKLDNLLTVLNNMCT